MATQQKRKIAKEDVQMWDGANSTFAAKSVTGATINLTPFDWNGVDAYALYGEKTSSAVNSALTTIGSSNAVLHLAPGTWAISDDVTIPSNITLQMPLGSIFSITAGKTVTVNGPIEAGHYAITGSTGALLYNGPDDIKAKWYGITFDGDTDDTAAWTLLIAGLPDRATVNTRCVKLPNLTDGEFSKVSSTLLFSTKYNVTIEAPARPYNTTDVTPSAAAARAATIKWYGDSTDNIIEFHYCEGIEVKNICVDGRVDISGKDELVGIAVGSDDLYIGSESLSMIKFDNCTARNCSTGFRFGNGWNSSDDRYITNASLENCAFIDNVNHGLSMVLAEVSASNCLGSGNGASPDSGGDVIDSDVGANVYAKGSHLNISNYRGSGTPNDADIYMWGAGLILNNAVSECLSPAIQGIVTNYAVGIITGLYHYSSDSMTAGNTPTSIQWDGATPLVLNGCYLYGDVELEDDTPGVIVDNGTYFKENSSTFVGTGITSNRSYIGIGTQGPGTAYNDDEARIAIGMPARVDGGDHKPLTVHSVDTMNGMVRATSTNNFVVTEVLDSTTESYTLGLNAYKDGASWESVATGMVGTFGVAVEDNAGDSPMIALGRETAATGADEAQTFVTNKIGWHSAAPTAGTWVAGDIVLDSSPSAGGTLGWVCTAGGTPGTWKTFGAITA